MSDTRALTYYRPEWTCGRYHSCSRSAIFYNLIEGVSYYFEDTSADVIGSILSASRNGTVFVNDIADDLKIDPDVIIDFFQQLVDVNLLILSLPTDNGIKNYRKQVHEYNCKQSNSTELSTVEKLPMAISNAEMEYSERTGGVTSVMFELTYNCSEQCIHCYNPGATRNSEEISKRGDRIELNIRDYKRIIDELYEEGLVKVCLSGGDPFSKPIVWDILDYLYSKDIAIDIYTNGQRIINDVERLSKYYPRTMGISIYSGIASEHDYITRIPGSWEKSMQVAKQLSELAVPLNLKCCVMRPNVKHYWMVSDICRQLGAESQYEINISDSIEGDICARNLRLPPELLEIVLRDDNIKLYVGPEAPNYGGQQKDMNNNGCGAAENTFCITPEGDFIPCCSFHMSFGNLKNKSLKEILQSSLLEKWRNLSLAQYEECGCHPYCDYCNLCPGMNFGEHSTPAKASENCCYTAKIRHSLAARMMEGYDPLNGKTFKECLEALPDYVPEKHRQIFRKKRDNREFQNMDN